MSLERVTSTVPSDTPAAAEQGAERAAKIEAGLAASEEVLAEFDPPNATEQAWVDSFMDLVTTGGGGSDGPV